MAPTGWGPMSRQYLSIAIKHAYQSQLLFELGYQSSMSRRSTLSEVVVVSAAVVASVTLRTASLVPVTPVLSTGVAELPPVLATPWSLPARSSRQLFGVSWVLLWCRHQWGLLLLQRWVAQLHLVLNIWGLIVKWEDLSRSWHASLVRDIVLHSWAKAVHVCIKKVRMFSPKLCWLTESRFFENSSTIVLGSLNHLRNNWS
jgi:hypothetical protein